MLILLPEEPCRGSRGYLLCRAAFDEAGGLTPWAVLYGAVYGALFAFLIWHLCAALARISRISLLYSLGAGVGAYVVFLVAHQVLTYKDIYVSHMIASGVGLLTLLLVVIPLSRH